MFHLVPSTCPYFLLWTIEIRLTVTHPLIKLYIYIYSGICVKDHYKSDLSASTFFASLVLCVMDTFWRVPKSTEV